MDRFLAFTQENWYKSTPTALAAYALWRLNWIHPFVEGNGRTARAVCYYLLCTKSGGLLRGSKIVPERIRENREPYYAALRAADSAWRQGNLDFSALEGYLASLLEAQLSDPGDIAVANTST
jgi:Fic family protein